MAEMAEKVPNVQSIAHAEKVLEQKGINYNQLIKDDPDYYRFKQHGKEVATWTGKILYINKQ